MANPKKVDFLIVGQGLAGTLLSFCLHKEGQSVLVIDPNHRHSSSAIAAGVVNPITGYRFVKSWLLDELLPVAESTYAELANLLGQEFYQKKEILRVLFSAGEENDWLARTAQEGWSKYVKDGAGWGEYEALAKPGFSEGLLLGAQLGVGQLIKAYQQYLQSQDLLWQDQFDYDQLKFVENGVQYQEVEASTVVFCEGYQGAQNPWFSYLPFEIVKGEVLLIRLNKKQAKRILKHKIILVPIGEDLYWVGSNYEHKPKDSLPSEKGKRYILERLQMVLKVPYEEVAHLAAIRPATFDRRPFLGRHPDHPALAIFNGLGAKGSSLAPYFAHQLTHHLLHGSPVHPEVQVNNRKKNKK